MQYRNNGSFVILSLIIHFVSSYIHGVDSRVRDVFERRERKILDRDEK